MSMDPETGGIGLYLWVLLASAVVFAVDIAAYGTCKPRRDEKDEDGFAVASNRPFRTVDTLGRPRLAGQLGGLGEALTYQRLGTLRS